MKLTPKNVEQIEKLLAMNMAVEVFITPEHQVDGGQGEMVPVPETLYINGRQPVPGEIRFGPVLLNTEADTTIVIRAHNPGEDPVDIVSLVIPKGESLSGLTTVKPRYG